MSRNLDVIINISVDAAMADRLAATIPEEMIARVFREKRDDARPAPSEFVYLPQLNRSPFMEELAQLSKGVSKEELLDDSRR